MWMRWVRSMVLWTYQVDSLWWDEKRPQFFHTHTSHMEMLRQPLPSNHRWPSEIGPRHSSKIWVDTWHSGQNLWLPSLKRYSYHFRCESKISRRLKFEIWCETFLTSGDDQQLCLPRGLTPKQMMTMFVSKYVSILKKLYSYRFTCE